MAFWSEPALDRQSTYSVAPTSLNTPIQIGMKMSETMIARNPSTIPAIATPPLVASPRLTRPRPTNPMMIAHRPRMMPPATDQQNISPMIASTSAVMPSPLRGPVGGGVKPEESCGGGGGWGGG